MHSDCLHRQNHHCHHAHNCTNPNHKSGSKQKSRDNVIGAQRLTEQHTQKSQRNLHEQNHRKTKPKCLSPQNEEQKTMIEKAMGNLKEKQRRIEQLQEELKRLRTKKHSQEEKSHPKEPACLVKKEDYEAMYRFVKFENDRLKLEVEEYKAMYQMAITELQIEREKLIQFQMKLNHNDHKNERLAFLEGEITRLEKIKKEYNLLNRKESKQDDEIKQLKAKLTQLSNFKDKSKDSNKNYGQIIKRLNEQKQAIVREKDLLRQRYQQHAKHNIELTDKLKQIKERNRIAMEDLNAQCKEKVKTADIKFGFSCDQINALRASEAKLKAKIKELEENLKNQQTKAKITHETKVEKELRNMYDKSTKENESLREKSLRYQLQNELLKDTIRELQTKSQHSSKEMNQILKLKELENHNLQSARYQTQTEIQRLKQADKKGPHKLQQTNDIDNHKKSLQHGPSSESRIPKSTQFEHIVQNTYGMLDHKQNLDLFGTNSNQRALVQSLQYKNVELQSQVQSLKSRLLTYEKQNSVNNWSQFESIIKQNNRRIKQLIIQKGKETEINSYLKVEIQQLKAKLNHPRDTIDHTTNQLYERSLNELQRLKAEVADRDFEVLQLRKEIYEVNNQYSEYYILKEDNEAMRHKINNFIEIIETLKRSGIHNSFQKEELIVQNQYLTDQLDRSRLYRT